MGRQVSFCVLPDDLAEFEEVLRQREAVFVAYYHPSPDTVLCSTLDTARYKDPMLWLARSKDLDRVMLKHVPQQGYWLVDQFRSPVVELSRGGPFDGTRAPRGRLYFRTTYLDAEAQALEPFPPDFVEWAQGILAWVRRRFVRDPKTGDYWGPRACEWRAGSGPTG